MVTQKQKTEMTEQKIDDVLYIMLLKFLQEQKGKVLMKGGNYMNCLEIKNVLSISQVMICILYHLIGIRLMTEEMPAPEDWISMITKRNLRILRHCGIWFVKQCQREV